MRRISALLAFTVLAASAWPAMAQPQVPPAQQAKPLRPVKDFDPVICERQEEIGSRLTTRKICHTRSQWAQLRQDDRNTIERGQSQRSMDASDGK